MKDCILFLPSAGLGTRLGSLTSDRPKALVEYNGKPLLEYQLEKALEHNFRDVLINIHYRGEKIIDYVQDLSPTARSLNIYFSDETSRLMDTGGAFVVAREYLKDYKYCLSVNSDILSSLNWREFFESYVSSRASAMLLCADRETSRKLYFSLDNRLIAWTNLNTGELKMAAGSEEASAAASAGSGGSEAASLNHAAASNEGGTAAVEAETLACSSKLLAYGGIHILDTKIIDFWAKKYGNEPFGLIDAYLSLPNEYCIKAYEAKGDLQWRDMGKPQVYMQRQI